ncbi:odorant receptor coreceptor-like [Uranotaenia lowii]|uniref:odorant receptor coreceptor-like n=1 Tax=Uranotaenia lowii TaxID=190385 RepID=UPI00247AFE5A|nr:odorant receptor coreceptor-like [Uranotaenia lowii]
MLRRIGLWEAPGRQIFRYYGVVFWMGLILIGPKAILGSGKEGFDSLARNTAELIFFTEVCISIGIFATRGESFRKLVQVLRESIGLYDSRQCLNEIGAFNRKMELFAKSYAAYIAFLVVMFLGVPFASTLFKLFFPHEGEYLLIVEIQFYWLDIRQNLLHNIVYLIFCSTAIFCSAYQSSMKGAVILVIIQYGTKLFDLIRSEIGQLHKVSTDKNRKAKLRTIIEQHKLALKYTKHLEDTVNFILINQILNCILIWCLMMFYVSTNFGPNAVTVIILFVVLMGEMVVYCVNGTMLSESAAAVGHAIYHHPWYEETVGLQKDMQLVMRRAQRPTGITAAKFYFVNIERLGLVVQASYSYYLILKKNF